MNGLDKMMDKLQFRCVREPVTRLSPFSTSESWQETFSCCVTAPGVDLCTRTQFKNRFCFCFGVGLVEGRPRELDSHKRKSSLPFKNGEIISTHQKPHSTHGEDSKIVLSAKRQQQQGIT